MTELGPTPAVIKRLPIHTEPAWTRPADIYSPPVAVDRDAQAILEARERERDSAGITLLRRWSMAELLAEPDDFAWQIQGMLADPTYGQIAGELKSFKTYLAAMIQVGLAAGVPILDRFQPAQPRPVVAYLGEGGRKPYMRRLRRIAAAMGVDLGRIPLHIVTEVAPIASTLFTETLARDLQDIRPGLVTIDPYYAYHGTKTKASDLHAEGALLAPLSARCLDAGANLLVVNHMNQTGSGFDIKRITMAGSGEWVDTWLLVGHRDTPDVDLGQFQLRIAIGSRQWGGTTWDLDLDVGRFDQDLGEHIGNITWTLQRTTAAKESHNQPDTALQIVQVLADKPGLTRTDVYGLIGGNKARFDQTFNHLADTGTITHNKTGQTTDQRPKGARWHVPTPQEAP